ncbi:hypothetical protein F442_21353 [Phytophthora nicotianae P10297]|uniref:Uncharacterized protein n=2 Tax=Phytophthora nicotianae TaxID=4792 RepID=W2Y447_PHYNI|nr:hypothetical protein L917_20649 [Phytophthora nicotianae]ETP29488.1 hypothetical protein F442_21358 [Phytophthora nicotianae P10297]ETP29507.1 hypothetical protein F442_21353 [Phytophthora nicotianae P10297]
MSVRQYTFVFNVGANRTLQTLVDLSLLVSNLLESVHEICSDFRGTNSRHGLNLV